MIGNNKEETKVLAATGPGATLGGAGCPSVGKMGLMPLVFETALPRLGVALGASSYDCTVCSKRHKVFRPVQDDISS